MRERGPLEPQVVQVALSDGDAETRLATLELDEGLLVLHQVRTSEDGSAKLGGHASVKVSSIGGVSTHGNCVQLRAGSSGGPTLMELRMESEDIAKAWGDILHKCRLSVKADGGHSPNQDDTFETLQVLVAEQQKRAKLLETLNMKKNEQLRVLQERLEAALGMLHEGRVAYATQQRVIDAQQLQINELKVKMPQDAQSSSSASESDGEEEEEENGEKEPDEQSAEVEAKDGGEADEEDFDEEEACKLLEKLHSLEQEKREFELQLREEREGVAGQLKELQEMMSSLHAQGESADPSVLAMLSQVLTGMGDELGGSDTEDNGEQGDEEESGINPAPGG